MLWKPAHLREQFKYAKEEGWLPFFQDAAKKYNLPVNILLAIGSRETNLKNILGDHHHGHGIMQIDDRHFPEWCASGKWRDPQEAIRMGAWVLRGFLASAHRWLHDAPTDDIMRAAIAAYNCGRKAFMNQIIHHNPDLQTTGANYSKDVLERAKIFAPLVGD